MVMLGATRPGGWVAPFFRHNDTAREYLHNPYGACYAAHMTQSESPFTAIPPSTAHMIIDFMNSAAHRAALDPSTFDRSDLPSPYRLDMATRLYDAARSRLVRRCGSEHENLVDRLGNVTRMRTILIVDGEAMGNIDLLVDDAVRAVAQLMIK